MDHRYSLFVACFCLRKETFIRLKTMLAVLGDCITRYVVRMERGGENDLLYLQLELTTQYIKLRYQLILPLKYADE